MHADARGCGDKLRSKNIRVYPCLSAVENYTVVLFLDHPARGMIAGSGRFPVTGGNPLLLQLRWRLVKPIHEILAANPPPGPLGARLGSFRNTPKFRPYPAMPRQFRSQSATGSASSFFRAACQRSPRRERCGFREQTPATPQAGLRGKQRETRGVADLRAPRIGLPRGRWPTGEKI